MPRKTRREPLDPRVAMPGFNEAAARCRGKRLSVMFSCCVPACFNEAAARCRGKPFAAMIRAKQFLPLQ